MAGLYITIGNSDSTRLDSVAKRMRFSNETEYKYNSEFSFIWLGHDNERLFGPAYDLVSGVRCIVGGRLSWPNSALRKAEILPYEGGIANRIILERYLSSGPTSIAPFNGAATIVIWDPRDQVVYVWTDQFGYHPVFFYGDDQKVPSVITTFPDAVKVDPFLDVKTDHVSMAEFLRAWRITPPYTYFQNLKHIGAATQICMDLKSGVVSKQLYWRPFENEFFPTIEEAADSLADALKIAIKERTAIANKSVFFVSGGADSRVMLFAADSPKNVWGINLYEKPTHESSIAKALCERIGSTYVGFGRDKDYYPRMQAENVRWSGAMWSVEDNHYLAVSDIVEKIDPDLVMTACTTDWVFKGYGLEKKYRQLFGKNLPIKRFIDKRVDGFLPNYPIEAPEEFKDEINERINNWFKGTPRNLKEDRDYLLVEDRRIRPTCYTVSVSGQIMYRTYPYDTFLADSRIADCYSRIPAKWKLNGEVWGLAAGKVCSKASDIEDSNFGWAVNAGMTSKLLGFALGWVRRRIIRNPEDGLSNEHPPSNASWPEMGWYATHSNTLIDFWYNTPKDHREMLMRLKGEDPWALSLNEWAKRPDELMRILTLLQHWQNIKL